MGSSLKRGLNDLQAVRPDLALEWDYEKNQTLTPRDIHAATSKKIWWICSIGHSYAAAGKSRLAGSGCPFCSNTQALPGFNDLATLEPRLLSEWDAKRNLPLSPDQVVPGSGRKVWWLCQLGHSTQSEIRVRVKFGCGICANRTLQIGFNDLATRFPEIAAEWDHRKNGGLGPSDVLFGARRTAAWKCNRGHEWSASIGSRTAKRTNCPYCSNYRAAQGDNDLSTLFPELAKEFDRAKNKVPLESIVPGSPTPRYWRCSLGHGYSASPHSRTRGGGCPYCANKRVLSGFNDLQTTDPHLALEWDYESNDLLPSGVIRGSHKKVYWLCELGHSYLSPIQNRIRGGGCNICSGRYVLAGFNDLATHAPHLVGEWDFSKNGTVIPTQISRWNERKFWWLCPIGHSYKATPSNRFIGRGCAVCDNRQIQDGVNDLASLFPHLMSEWDFRKNPDVDPKTLVRGTNRKVWWKCPNGHSYRTAVSSRTIVGVGCSKCSASGYSTARAGILYFIRHQALKASKIGITNRDNRHSRIERFRSHGWEVVGEWHGQDGFEILEAETKLFRWIRNDLGLPHYLGREELGSLGGWSETFASDGVESKKVIEMIEATLAEVRNSSK